MNFPIDPALLIPHGSHFIFPDQVIHISDTQATASFTISDKSFFTDDKKNVPTYTGVEYMAQTIACFAGYHNLKKQLPIQLGFLLGTRDFQIFQPSFQFNLTYLVKAQMLFQEEELGSFDCQITNQVDNITICKAILNVYQPKQNQFEHKKDD